ncbi:MAG: hypothetical protein ACFFAN_08230 [Promethearchaeota archaeon]
MVEWVDSYFRPLAQLAGLFMLILGVMWLIFSSYEANRRKSWKKLTKVDDWDFDITKVLKLLTYSGFVVGIFSIIIGAAGLILNEPPSLSYSTQTSDSVNYFTSIFLIIFGILTFIKPLNDLPISSIVGLAASTIVTVAILWVIMYFDITISTTIAIALIVIFIIIFAIVAITVKFYTVGLMVFSKIISWPPIAFIIAIICFIQGILLLAFGISMI